LRTKKKQRFIWFCGCAARCVYLVRADFFCAAGHGVYLRAFVARRIKHTKKQADRSHAPRY